jgi:hypothetical protein
MYEARSLHPKISPEQTVCLFFSSFHLNKMTLFFRIQKKLSSNHLKGLSREWDPAEIRLIR